MSWYKKEASSPKVLLLIESYVQVPSSSPINIKSSPSKNHRDLQPPSRLQLESNSMDEEEKQRKLEAKRQAIRSHHDFPVVRRKFYYLQESDIFKGFVKGKGNLRDVTQWLTDNYNKEEILSKKEEENKALRELQEKERKRLEEEKFRLELASRERLKQQQEDTGVNSSDVEDKSNNNINGHNSDTEMLPVKIVRGKARVKLIGSSQPNGDSESTATSEHKDDESTNVNISKPRVSILDKYKYKPKSGLTQSRLDSLFKSSSTGSPEVKPQKKRRLVRASDANGTESESNNDSGSVTPITSAMHTPPVPLSQLSSSTALHKSLGHDTIPKLKLKLQDFVHPNFQGKVNVDDDEDDNGIVADDDLERLEEKIRENRKLAKARRGGAAVAADDDEEEELEDDMELEDDELSDGLSQEEEDDHYGGLTSIDSQILEFLNDAPKQDIVEICQVPPDVADVIISKRPFENIYAIAEEKFEQLTPPPEENAGIKKRRQNMRKPLGQKIIELTEKSLKGYKAVDSLIKKCSEYGDLITKQMETWGVTVTGEGELEVVELTNTQDGTDVIEIENEDDDEDDDDIKVVSHTNKSKKLRYYDEKPSLLASEIELKNYQQVGINWLNLLYQNKLSCILADEMGLGKTCQVISFMALLKEISQAKDISERKKKTCHLVVVPASTLENWMREFQKFCPDIIVQAYYGSQREREELRYELQDQEFDVLVTTYNLATGAAPDFKFLRSQPFDMIVYDEGHMLKNSTSERYTKLMRLKANFRLLLTGTPLQNNLKELVSLLAFMLPGLFSDKKEDLEGLFNQKISTNDTHKDYNPLLSQQAITKAKTMMTPFVLRRKKDQVLKHLPAKTHKIEYCEPSKSQKSIYTEYMKQAKSTRLERERRKLLSPKELIAINKLDPIPSSTNVMMSLRKASLHPLLFRKIYDEKKLKIMSKAIMEEPEYVEANQEFIYEDMCVMSDYELNNLCKKFPHTLSKYVLDKKHWFESGKVTKALEIVNSVMEKKNKVLIFSLFTQMLDILETALSFKKIKFLRLDGQTSVELRQDIIDQFYDDDLIPVFLLSTKAGGFGINLVVANNVIIFDQSFNPHDDRQAEDRAHRVGQEKEVLVTKLITRNTIEENMLQLAQNKLALDQSISSEDGNEKQFEEKAASLFEKILFSDDSKQNTPI